MNYRRGQKARDFFFLAGESSQSHTMTVQQHPFGMKCYQAVLSVVFSFPVMGRSAVHREKQMFLIAPVSASRKNNCRKLLWPLLPFALYFFSFKQQNLFSLRLFFFLWFFLWLGFIPQKEEPWRRGKNRLHAQLAQGDSNHSSQLLGKASLRFPRQADLKAMAARTRENAAAESPWGRRELRGGRRAGGKHGQNLLFMVETPFLSHKEG